MGQLIPIGLTEVLPGDTIQQATSALVRMSPLLAPVMHPLHARIHHWFVPHRLVWEDWEDFITGGADGMDASVFPTIAAGSFGPGSSITTGQLADYYGLPPGNVSALGSVSALPFRGYNLIWNEWYRDQDLQTEASISYASGTDALTYTPTPKNVAWEKDYFTSARPWPSKGPDITIPMAETAPVVADGGLRVEDSSSGTESNLVYKTSFNGALGPQSNTGWADGEQAVYVSGLEADLQAAPGTINELRTAFALMRYQEARARYGSRYVEYLRYLGVKSSDARLQRPEYLGGGKQTIQFSEVMQTAPGTDSAEDTVGALKGHGIGAMRSNRYRRFFEEHGYIHSFISVKPKTIYAQGVPRTWNRRTKEDFFQKELQFIGQQEVYNKEIYGLSATPNGIFGYQDRYDEYRRQESTIAGEFRNTLDYWHMARIFSSEPALNASFVEAVPTERIFADNASDVLWIMANHSIQARRLVSNKTDSSVF